MELNKVYSAKDYKKITEHEILMLIDWYLDKNIKNYDGLFFASHAREGYTVHMKFEKVKDEPALDEFMEIIRKEKSKTQ